MCGGFCRGEESQTHSTVQGLADVVLVDDCQAQSSQVLSRMCESHRPFVTTQHGKAVVVLSLEEYERLQKL